MCLDIEHSRKNKNKLKNSIVYEENRENLEINMEHATTANESSTNLGMRSLCGGSIVEHKPIFDFNQE